MESAAVGGGECLEAAEVSANLFYLPILLRMRWVIGGGDGDMGVKVGECLGAEAVGEVSICHGKEVSVGKW